MTASFFFILQFPQELVTYGGNGQVFSNWAQVIPELACVHVVDLIIMYGVCLDEY